MFLNGICFHPECRDGETSTELCQFNRKRYSQVLVYANNTLATGNTF